MNIWLFIGLGLSVFPILAIRDSRPKLVIFGILLFFICGLYTYYSWDKIWWACMFILPIINLTTSLTANYVVDLYYTLFTNKIKIRVSKNWVVILNNQSSLSEAIYAVKVNEKTKAATLAAKKQDLLNALLGITDRQTANHIKDIILTICLESIKDNNFTIADFKRTIISIISTELNTPSDRRLSNAFDNKIIYNNIFNATFETLSLSR